MTLFTEDNRAIELEMTNVETNETYHIYFSEDDLEWVAEGIGLEENFSESLNEIVNLLLQEGFIITECSINKEEEA